MKINKVLNNNVVMAHDFQKGEVVVVGTGIGFHAKPGDRIDKNSIQKIFVVSKNTKLMDLIEQIPASYLELTEKIYEYAEKKYHISTNDEAYLILTDHIYFAIKRINEGIDLDNPFLADIKQFYKNEYQVGLFAREEIKKMFQTDIPEEEVGYIAMHIVETGGVQKKKSFDKIFEVINVSLQFIKMNYLHEINEDSLSYTRLENHVKYFASRYIENKENDSKDDLLTETIQEVFKEEVQCINELSLVLFQEFGRYMSDSEKNYLVLHLRNCKNIKE